LHFAQPVIDVGEVRSGAPLVQELRFTIDGPEAVDLLEARPSCGCLRPQLEPRRYWPGESGTLLLEVNTLTQAAGEHTWRLDLRCRRADVVEEVSVAVKGRIIAELAVQPSSLTLLTAGPLSQELVLTDMRERPLQRLELRTSSQRLRATVQQRALNATGHAVFRIGLDIAGDMAPGRYDDSLDIYTDDAVYRHLHVPVTVIRQGRQQVTAMPSQVTFRGLGGQPLPSQLIRLRAASNEPVVVADLTADDPAILCRWAKGPDNLATVRVQIDPTRLHGNLASAIHVRVSGPTQEMLTVPVSCAVE
jgi:hypothetical protein